MTLQGRARPSSRYPEVVCSDDHTSTLLISCNLRQLTVPKRSSNHTIMNSMRAITPSRALRAATFATRPTATSYAGIGGTSFVRGKATLPELSCMCRRPSLSSIRSADILNRRLRCTRASDLWSNHGAPPRQAPQHLRKLI